MALTYNQLNLLDMFNTARKPIASEYLNCYDGRSLRRLLLDGLIEVKKHCGCNHACGCKSYVKVTEAGQSAVAGFNYRTHKKAPGGVIVLGINQ